MAKWLEQVSLRHEMYCLDLEVMNLNPCWVKLGVLLSQVVLYGLMFSSLSLHYCSSCYLAPMCYSLLTVSYQDPGDYRMKGFAVAYTHVETGSSCLFPSPSSFILALSTRPCPPPRS